LAPKICQLELEIDGFSASIRAELTAAARVFYLLFTQDLNRPFIYGVPQSKRRPGFRIVHLHNKWVHRTTIRRSIHNI